MKKAGFVKVYRQVMDRNWIHHSPTLCLYVHLLMQAGWTEKTTAYGNVLKPGQLETSIRCLARDTGLTSHEVRTAISHLQKTSDISVNTCPGCRSTVITILYPDAEAACQEAVSDISHSEAHSEKAQESPLAQGPKAVQPIAPVTEADTVQQSLSDSHGAAYGTGHSEGHSIPAVKGTVSTVPQDPEYKALPDADTQTACSGTHSRSQGDTPGQALSQGQATYNKNSKNNKNNKKECKEAFGEGRYVLLTREEYDKLQDRYGSAFLEKCIEKLDSYIGSKGKDNYNSHYYTITGWVKDEIRKQYPGLIKKTYEHGHEKEDSLAEWGESL